jgi:hypothetical protein
MNFFTSSLFQRGIKIQAKLIDDNAGSDKFIPPLCKGRLGGIFHGLKNRLCYRFYL